MNMLMQLMANGPTGELGRPVLCRAFPLALEVELRPAQERVQTRLQSMTANSVQELGRKARHAPQLQIVQV